MEQHRLGRGRVVDTTITTYAGPKFVSDCYDRGMNDCGCLCRDPRVGRIDGVAAATEGG